MKLDTKEAYQQIANDNKTMSYPKIIEKYNLDITVPALKYRMKKFIKEGAVIVGNKDKRQPIDMEIVKKLSQEGKPSREIAEIIGYSASHVIEKIKTMNNKDDEFTPVYMTLPAEVRTLATGRWV